MSAQSQNRLGSSLRTQAFQALSNGDLKAAASLYERWLEADPRDKDAWYNLACVRALMGEKRAALDAWENAVEAGFTDAAFAQRDGDLQSIRDDPRFLDAVKRIDKNKATGGPAGFIRRYEVMQSRGTYIVMLPSDYATSNKRYPVIVILHGSGSNETSHGQLADDFGRDGVIYVAPRAPYGSGSVANAGQAGYTAWPPEDFEPIASVRNDYVEWIFQTVRTVQREYRTLPGRVSIYGHSQGGQFAMLSALLHPNQVTSIFVQAGSQVPDEYFTRERLAAIKAKGITVWICHGEQDGSVPVAQGKALSDRLKAAGIPVIFRSVPGIHTINPQMREIAREWKTQQVSK
jgi:predicted esterase